MSLCRTQALPGGTRFCLERWSSFCNASRSEEYPFSSLRSPSGTQGRILACRWQMSNFCCLGGRLPDIGCYTEIVNPMHVGQRRRYGRNPENPTAIARWHLGPLCFVIAFTGDGGLYGDSQSGPYANSHYYPNVHINHCAEINTYTRDNTPLNTHPIYTNENVHLAPCTHVHAYPDQNGHSVSYLYTYTKKNTYYDSYTYAYSNDTRRFQ